MTEKPHKPYVNIISLMFLIITPYMVISNHGYEIPFVAGPLAYVLLLNIRQRQELRRRVPKNVGRAIAIAGILGIIVPIVSYPGPMPLATISDYAGWTFLIFIAAALAVHLHWPDDPDNEDQDGGDLVKEDKPENETPRPTEQVPE